MERTSIGVGLMGLGVVGGGVARILRERGEEYARQVGLPLELRRVLVREPEKERTVRVDPALLTTRAEELLEDPGVDILAEVMGGEEPAYQYLRRALQAGKYVVTANKEVMAKHGPELLALAQRAGVDVLYEASVGGGIPLIAPLKRDLLANQIYSIHAIINGTTNYILTRMAEEGTPYEEALAQAQALGYAEPDPASDVEGIDAAYKLAILASLAFRTQVRPEDVYREGVTRLHSRDFRYARELGYAIKLLAIGQRTEQGIQVRVHPALLPAAAPLAKVDGVFNAVQLEGDLLGQVLFQGQGAGSLPTTSAVLADIIDAARDIVLGVRDRPAWRSGPEASVQDISALETRYYFRLEVMDRPGVLAQIARIFGENGISIASVIQKEVDEEVQRAELVIMTHRACEAALRRTLQNLEELEVVHQVGNVLRVED